MVATGATLTALPKEWAPCRGRIFLGTGIGSRGDFSIGLPYDVLSMVITAANANKALGLDGVVHLVADRIDAGASMKRSRAAAQIGRESAAAIERAVEAFGFADYEVVTASALEAQSAYKALLASIPVAVSAPYLRYEVADTLWFHTTVDAVVKVGWVIDPTGRTPWRLDERYFDSTVYANYGAVVAPLYCVPGRNDDPRRPRCSPYVFASSENRPALRPILGWPLKLPRSRSMRSHLEILTSACEQHLRLASDGDLVERITQVQRRLFPEVGAGNGRAINSSGRDAVGNG
jgi:hypothetical protein